MAEETVRRPRLAILETDEAVLQLLVDIFTDAGFVVTLAVSLDEFPGSWKGDIVVTDSGGPRYNREAVAERIRMLREQTGARVVLVSTHAEARDDGAILCYDAFVAKPFDIHDLVETARALATR